MAFYSRRSAILARRVMVATSQPLAAMVGVRTLMEGGNAVDAAVQLPPPLMWLSQALPAWAATCSR